MATGAAAADWSMGGRSCGTGWPSRTTVGPAALLLGLLCAGELGRPGLTAMLAEAGRGLAMVRWVG